MSVFFNLSNHGTDEANLSVVGPFGERSITKTHPNFNRLVEYFLATPTPDADEVERLVDPTKAIGEAVKAISNLITVDLKNVYFMGVPVTGGLGDHLLQRLHEGEDWERFARFLANLEENPSARAKDAVFQWVERNGLTITEDGRFLGYKAVQETGLSSHAGPNNFVNGVLYGEPGVSYHVPHEVGSVISKRRGDVDENTKEACSTGLHVGTEKYAKGFAPRLLTVAVNPRDVVSVPDSDLEWKIRVSEYEVISIADDSQFQRSSYNLATSETVGDEDDWTNWGDEDVEPEVEEEDFEFDNDSLAERDEAYAVEPDEFTEQDGMGQVAIHVTTPAGAQYPRPTSTYAGLTLAQVASQIPALKADLDSDMGHKPLARKWGAVTTESSVRRYRKSHNG